MAVSLWKRPLRTDKIALYLVYHINGKRYRENLELQIYKRPKDVFEKKHNEDTKNLAESIRSKKEQLLNASDIEVTPSFIRKINFIDFYKNYVENYTKKDVRMMQASLKYFKAFLDKRKIKTILPKDVNKLLCSDYFEFLKDDCGLSGETPADYFQRFRKMLSRAVDENIFSQNPASTIKASKGSNRIEKDILLSDEIQHMARAECGNAEVKRAFLFACFTGLRFSDIVALKWHHIKNEVVIMAQEKTQQQVKIQINSTAKKLLGEVPSDKGDEHIFALPSHTAVLKVLKNWTKRAGIDKHVTFHVARHSFGTNLMIYDGNIKSVSSLLGHTTLKHTEKYVRVVEDLKQRAVNALPQIEL